MDERVKTDRDSSVEDARLARAFLAGEGRAFEKLVAKHQDRIFNLCLWMLADRQEADDAAQETFIKVYRSLGKFKFKSAFSTWLYRIAVNNCKNRIGSAYFSFKRKNSRLDTLPADNGSHSTLEIADPSPLQNDVLEQKETTAAIMAAIAALPKDRRTVVVLRDVEGMSYEEIAVVTGFNVGTVKSRISRGRRQLQKLLKGLK